MNIKPSNSSISIGTSAQPTYNVTTTGNNNIFIGYSNPNLISFHDGTKSIEISNNTEINEDILENNIIIKSTIYQELIELDTIKNIKWVINNITCYEVIIIKIIKCSSNLGLKNHFKIEFEVKKTWDNINSALINAKINNII